METPKNVQLPSTKQKYGASRKSVGTMKSIEKNKKTLNVPLTGRLASIGVQKLPNVSSETDLSVRNP